MKSQTISKANMLVGSKYYREKSCGKGGWRLVAWGRVVILDQVVWKGLSEKVPFG